MLELDKLYNADCMQGMKEFPDKYFDLAIVDVPYGIDVMKKAHLRGKKKWGKALAVSEKYDYSEWDKQPPPAEYFTELIMGGVTAKKRGANTASGGVLISRRLANDKCRA